MMIAPVSSIAEMNRELRACVDGVGFQFDCGAGGKLDPPSLSSLKHQVNVRSNRRCH